MTHFTKNPIHSEAKPKTLTMDKSYKLQGFFKPRLNSVIHAIAPFTFLMTEVVQLLKACNYPPNKQESSTGVLFCTYKRK